jgi:hypothetical protein
MVTKRTIHNAGTHSTTVAIKAIIQVITVNAIRATL